MDHAKLLINFPFPSFLSYISYTFFDMCAGNIKEYFKIIFYSNILDVDFCITYFFFRVIDIYMGDRADFDKYLINYWELIITWCWG